MKATDTIQQLIQNLGQKLPDAQYQDAYVAHMDVLSEALAILSKAHEPVYMRAADCMFDITPYERLLAAPSKPGAFDPDKIQAVQDAAASFMKAHGPETEDQVFTEVQAANFAAEMFKPLAQDDGWRTDGLPEIGAEVEIEVANGEILAGVVKNHLAGYPSGYPYDLLIEGPDSVPSEWKNDKDTEWMVGIDAPRLDKNELRVRWRMKPAKPDKALDDWRSDGLPEIGDTVEIELGTGEVVSGEVSDLDTGGSWDLCIAGPMSTPKQYRAARGENGWWWTGNAQWAAPNSDRRRVRWRKIQNP